MNADKGTALVTGASSGIGAIYDQRLRSRLRPKLQSCSAARLVLRINRSKTAGPWKRLRAFGAS